MKEYTIVYDEKNHERKYIRYEAGIPIILSKDIVIDECNKEIERLNNIINELEKYYEEELKNLNYSEDKIYAQGIHDTIIDHKYKLQELKGDGSNE